MSSDDDFSGDGGAEPLRSLFPNVEPGRKKKRGMGKTAASRGPTAMAASRGTGFEEYFADPPMTPAEALDEKVNVYAPDLPVHERIQSCIQRFRARRRLTTQQAHFFNEYLLLGGVDSNPNAFSGIDQRELKNLTPAERRDATAIDGLHLGEDETGKFYNGDENSWSVDFTSVVKGFLSVSVIPLTGLESTPMEICIAVVETFLRYVLQHDVCPEHEDDLHNALGVCQKAREEWPRIKMLQALMPGRLNDAAAELFQFREAEDFARIDIPDGEEVDEMGENGEVASARAVVFTAFALLETDGAIFHRLSDAWRARIMTLQHIDCAIQLKSLERASRHITNRFARLRINETRSIPAIGKAIFTRTTIKDGWDMPDLGDKAPSIPEEVTLYFDDRIMKNLVLGMKMTATLVYIPEAVVYFLKKTGPLLPSFYRFLPQELMKRYKEPREMDRPAPSIHDREQEEAKAEDDAVPAEAEA
ncbi:hypothetical protein CC79DRAFT_1370529 [Sarocladium strictum]